MKLSALWSVALFGLLFILCLSYSQLTHASERVPTSANNCEEVLLGSHNDFNRTDVKSIIHYLTRHSTAIDISAPLDALLELQDPYGEFVALSCEALRLKVSDDVKSRALYKKAEAISQKHGREWMPAIARGFEDIKPLFDDRGILVGLTTGVQSKTFTAYQSKGGFAEFEKEGFTALKVSNGLIDSSSVRTIVKLQNLTHLTITYDDFDSNAFLEFKELPRLTSLFLIARSSFGQQGASAVSTLKGLTHLRFVLYQDTGIGPDGARMLATLKNLTHLDLHGAEVGPEGAKALATLHQLVSLRISGNKIGDEGARAIAGLQNLIHLETYDNDITKDGAIALAALQKLIHLNIGFNKIGIDGARAIATLQNLTHLEIGYTDIGTEGARAIATLQNLIYLNIQNNLIGDEGARAIATIQSLTGLNASMNSFTTDGFEAISTLRNLELFQFAELRILTTDIDRFKHLRRIGE